MLKAKIISRVLAMYEKPPLSVEYQRAFFEFFTDTPAVSLDNEVAQKLFHEWFIFHFHLITGRTPLEQCILNNETRFSLEERVEAEVLHRARFDLFEVHSVVPGKEVIVQALSDDRIHQVTERLGSQQMHIGTWIFGRLASMTDHAEFVGGLLVELPTKLSPESRKHWKNMFRDVTPQDVFSYLLKEEKPTIFEDEQATRARVENQMPLDEARSYLVTLFKKHDIEKFVSVPKVEKWCNQRRHDTTDPRWIMGIVLGLADDTAKDAEELLTVLQHFINAIPRLQFYGKSPVQKADDRSSESESHITSFITNFHEWRDHAKEAHDSMKSGRIQDAVEAYRYAFESLLEARTTVRDIYRLYANTAVALFAYGDEYGGRALLKRATQLNPLYDFAAKQSERLAAGEFDNSILYGRMSAIAELGPKAYRQMYNRKSTYEQEPWYQYDMMLKRFKINFHHPLDEPSKITIFSQDGRKLGRNESCPCGNGKKYKKCHGSAIL